jgi:hypothetical protein
VIKLLEVLVAMAAILFVVVLFIVLFIGIILRDVIQHIKRTLFGTE